MIEIVDWRYTSKCNNNCFYCYASTNSRDLDRKEKTDVLNKIIESGCKYICLSGGEPLIHGEECVDFIKYAYANGIKIHLSTNGFNYLKYADEIHNKIARLSLPLDGFDSESNACNGRSKDAFDHVIGVLERISKFEKNPFIKINTTITALNSTPNNLLQIYNILKKYPIDLWEIYEFIPENRGVANLAKLDLKEGFFDQLENDFRDVIKEPVFNVEFASRKSRNSRYFIIQSDGAVVVPIDRGEIVEEFVVGNLLKEKFDVLFSKWEEVAVADSSFQKKRIMQSGE